MLYPLPPVMVSCGTMERANIITVAWTGIVNSEPPMTYISVRPERFSHGLIKETVRHQPYHRQARMERRLLRREIRPRHK